MEQIRENTLSPPYVLEFVQSNNLLLRSHTPVSFENLQRKQNTTVETTKNTFTLRRTQVRADMEVNKK